MAGTTALGMPPHDVRPRPLVELRGAVDLADDRHGCAGLLGALAVDTATRLPVVVIGAEVGLRVRPL